MRTKGRPERILPHTVGTKENPIRIDCEEAKWLKKPPSTRECDICYEEVSKQAFSKPCTQCTRSICIRCRCSVTRCPFCREKLKSSKVRGLGGTAHRTRSLEYYHQSARYRVPS